MHPYNLTFCKPESTCVSCYIVEWRLNIVLVEFYRSKHKIIDKQVLKTATHELELHKETKPFSIFVNKSFKDKANFL